ncbi:manganese efflux pump [Maribacter polysiphoniae]|uniref:Manganese efflux pump n=1 Tax=Maribacter polysiphoniae TaxID=429344 RepID=A0A316E501_9FLAO|nr:manganese efflux pump [Maribacter polysiphoniae]MBD1260976.1 manganese efflux pump [Maribacter polysiphoniae]PWK23783.1 putative manganese efflux pump [Maribacter polysiphoniae]
METNEINAGIKAAQINNALGFFIMAFGVIVLFAMIFTETFVEHMTDMVAGLLLIAIGGGMIWKAKSNLKKYRKSKES